MTKILAIDDKQDNLTTLSAVLKNLIPGCTVITAQSGAKGIEKARKELPDTILLDIKMPRIDGFEVCKRLKSDDKTRHIPIIMLTAARTDTKSRIKGLDLGADAFLSKPIDEVELTAQINVMLRIKKAEDILRKEKDLLEDAVQERTKQLSESETRFRLLYERAPSPYHALNEDGNLMEVNEAWLNMLGYSREEVIGRWFGDFLDPQYVDYFKRNFTHFKASDGVGGIEIEMVRKDGSCVTVEFNGNIGYDKNGKFKQTHCIFQNITERKRAEEEKKKLEKQLHHAQKLEAIGTLAGGIAHDFNNILAGIMGYTEMALHQFSKRVTGYEYLHRVLDATYRAKDLVKQILAFSRQVEQERKPVQIALIIKEAIKLLRASLPSTIELRQNIEAASCTVLADPTRIHQVLINLCTNAAHAMREKGGVLEVILAEVDIDADTAARHPELKVGPYLRLSVSDTGHGMAGETMDRIFDPYFTTKEKGKGTGLGLAVVHGIIKSLGGTITVDSEPGKGTTFQVFLHRIETRIKPHVETAVPLPRGHECILLVDDEEHLADMWLRMLEHLGYEVVAKTSGIKALEIFRSQPDKFDIVITDQTMPKMTGVDLAKELMHIRSNIPIILCSGFSEAITPEKAKAMGIREFVMKPMVMREMAETIRRVVEKGL